ncbi:hypothetical protein [Burkholderia sp. Ac-20365]|uniref:hypothetical protein n=1 Tax=Burkholderia sp. Ac-20365 TaxID=2703897 RepID=UPI00197C8BFA|nr:hypothetical protein [Burkholderia sp. Ac-20365]MBN3760984.1 hypothetical protein [Burkholderia sp. Ac-20365]
MAARIANVRSSTVLDGKLLSIRDGGFTKVTREQLKRWYGLRRNLRSGVTGALADVHERWFAISGRDRGSLLQIETIDGYLLFAAHSVTVFGCPDRMVKPCSRAEATRKRRLAQ